MTTEKPDGLWLPVPGWEGLYEASDQGQVWSCVRRKGIAGPHLMRTPPDENGYPQVNLCRDGSRRRLLVHWIIATTFHGPRPAGMECRHLDGDPANNAAGNLKWGTPSENNYDRVRHGTFVNRNMGKTHCDHGHEFNEDNTYLQDGRRRCWTCRRRRNQEQAARRKAARHARGLLR